MTTVTTEVASAEIRRVWPAKFWAGRTQFSTALVFVTGDDLVAVRRKRKNEYSVARVELEPGSSKWSPDGKRLTARVAGESVQVTVKSKKSCGCGKTVNELGGVVTLAQLDALLAGA